MAPKSSMRLERGFGGMGVISDEAIFVASSTLEKYGVQKQRHWTQETSEKPRPPGFSEAAQGQLFLSLSGVSPESIWSPSGGTLRSLSGIFLRYCF